ncbi:MAG: RNA polymerase Rpb4 family protein [Candidatus Micrarchaeota archaeon]
MIGKGIISQKAVALVEVQKIMEARKGDGELGFEQQATYDYLKVRTLLPEKKAEEMADELVKLERVSQEIAIKIVDLLPKSESQLSVIVAKERHTFSKAEMAEILKIVEKYATA